MRHLARQCFSAAEWARRRATLGQLMPNNSVAIVLGYPMRHMAHDVPHVFWQQPDLLYLTGYEHPDAIAVFEKSSQASDGVTCTMFVDAQPPSTFNEGTPTLKEMRSIYGADDAYARHLLDDFLHEKAKQKPMWLLPDREQMLAPLLVQLRPMLGSQPSKWSSITSLVHQQRLVKSAAEIDVMRRVCGMTARGFRETIQWCGSRSPKPLAEQLLASRLEYEFVAQGGRGHSFPPVAAGGPRGVTVHYISNVHDIQPNEMVLVDAGTWLCGYNGDITRTWPHSGRFSAAQRELYESTLHVQVALIEALKSKSVTTMRQLHEYSVQLASDELHRLGFKDLSPQRFEVLYPHLVGHYLGMDIHDTDTVAKSHPLIPGMVVTVEPGFYVPSQQPYPARYQGLAVRIEDDVLITEDGAEVLTHEVPKEVDELEALLSQRAR